MGRHGIKEPLGDFVRVSVEEANPLSVRRFDARQAFQQVGKAVGEAQVLAVAGGVLPDQVDLAHTALEQARGFGNHRFEAPAAKLAAVLRDHAEGAGMVAAFGNLDVGEVARSGQDARGEVVVEVGLGRRVRFQALAQSHDALQLVGAHQGVYFRQLLADIATVPLHQAAGYDQLLRAADFLVLGHLQNGVHGLFFGGIDEAARVDHQHVRLVRMRGQLVALGHKLAHHDFAIHQVFGAA